ncbi:hypothetical protein [Yoonia sp.]|uniref:hypothetical protein n=1 Tax=Yoonia sp. TaxID=2212373 RepID=UPI002FD9DA38
MKRSILILLVPLAACSGDAVLFPLPLMTPAQAAETLDRRGAVEVYVKTNHPALVDEIDAGGGPTLTRAMDIAGIPLAERPTRQIQLRSDNAAYRASPGALVSVLMLYAG